MACDVATLVAASQPFIGLASKERSAIKTSIMQEILGTSDSLQTILNSANSFSRLPGKVRETLMIAVLCEIAGET